MNMFPVNIGRVDMSSCEHDTVWTQDELLSDKQGGVGVRMSASCVHYEGSSAAVLASETGNEA